MITTLMVYSLVVGIVLGAGAMLADVLARRAGISQRFVWFVALALLVTLTFSAPWRGSAAESVILPLPTSDIADVQSAEAVSAFTWTSLGERITSALGAPGNLLSDMVALSALDASPGVNIVIGAAWSSLAVVLLVLLTLTLRRLDVQRRRMPHAELHGISVRVGTNDGPAVYGVLSPEIVVPSSLLARSHDEQRLVLAHEDEHRRARDPLLLAITAGLVALLPWHPVAWWCASRIRLATELDCDARVLRRGTSARRYGALLLTAAETMSSAPRARHALALLDSRRHLERRILAMTTRTTRRAPLAVAAFALIGGSAVFAACNTDIPTAAEVRDADAQSVVRQLGLPSGSGQIVYYVDGKRMADAETVPAEEIASIEVLRKRAAGEVSEVYIRTLKAGEGELRRVATNAAPEEDSVRVVLGRTRYLGEEEARADSARKGILRVSGSRMKVRADSTTLTLTGDVTQSALNRDGSADVTRLKSPNRIMLRSSDSSSAAQPLVVLDGVISTDQKVLSKLDPNRIESIEVLKGAAASTIYGARGANGVIQIRTKK